MKLETRFNLWQRTTEEWREAALKPLLRLFVIIGINAHALSTLRILLAAAFPLLVLTYQRTAWLCIAVSILLDAVDGALARFAKTASDRGKFIDVFADQLTFSLLAVGLLRLLPELSIALTVSAFAIPALYLLVAVADNEKKPSDWLIRPQARLTVYKIVFLLILAGLWLQFWNLQTVNALLWLELIICSLHFSYRYILFINKPAINS